MTLSKGGPQAELKPSWWRQYKYYSDPTAEARMDIAIKNLMSFDKEVENLEKKGVKVRDSDFQKASSKVEGSGWDKYYFFSDPETAKLGRKRVASEGPNTFSPDYVKKNTKPLDKNMQYMACFILDI